MRTLFLPIALCLSSGLGCVAAEVTLPLDLDGDGLLGDVEEALGTDPENPDSDDDGWTDGEEYDENTDPLNADSKPYTGGWQIDDCEVEATGKSVGDISENFSLEDQHGEMVDLHDFCNRVVLLIAAAEW
ncbi:MAG: hypothetical protein VX519_05315 [Myxococcota bacterium]|nr:hypothetical protein [Myxococcota bacterium]